MGRLNKYQLVVWGRYPSLNEWLSAIIQKKEKGNAMKQKSQNQIIACILAQAGRLRIRKKIKIRYTYFEPNRKRDLDNVSGYFHKVFQDALVQCGAIENDNWNHIVGFSDRFFVDRGRPRIEIEIIEVE